MPGPYGKEHPSVPNGFDPPRHSEYRRFIEPFFSEQNMTEFEPVCRDLANSILTELAQVPEIEFAPHFEALRYRAGRPLIKDKLILYCE